MGHVEETSVEKVGDEPIANPSASEPQGATQQEPSKEPDVEVEPAENVTSAPAIEPVVQDPAPEQSEVAANETNVEEEEEAGAVAIDSLTKVDGVVEAFGVKNVEAFRALNDDECNVDVNENTVVEPN